MAALLACRVDINELNKIMVNANFSSFVDTKISNIILLPYTYGLCGGKKFESWLFAVIKDLTGIHDPSLKQIYELFGTTFTCAVTNISTGHVEYFNTDTHPNMSLVTCIRASASIPFIFNPVCIDGSLYIDGGLIDNFMTAKFDPKHTLGFSLIKSRQVVEVTSLLTYIHAIVNTIINSYTDHTCDIIKIACKEKSPINFNMCRDDLNELVLCGKSASAEYIKRKLSE